MSPVVSFISQNRVMILKMFFIAVLGASALYLVKIKNPLQDKPQILGKESADPLKIVQDQVTALIDNSVKTTSEATSDVLGAASRIVQETASRSANSITKNVIQSASEVIVKQIEKLPQKDQEEVKKYICN